LSATVCGPDLTFADAFATGLLAAGEPGFPDVRRAGYEALVVRTDGSCAHTPAFPFAGATNAGDVMRRSAQAIPTGR
jgi:thiamine biosynthesis lipoprotein ApbE